MIEIVKTIAGELSLKDFQVQNTVELLFKDECTIPFVARYRKERTGSLDEVQIRAVRDRFEYLNELETSKDKYLKVVAEHCAKKPELATQYPILEKKFRACKTKQELEDLYLPFKPKRRTRAQVAREKGLEPLADKLAVVAESVDLMAEAAGYVTKNPESIDATLVVKSAAEALAGAADILAERYSEFASCRALVRRISQETGFLVAKKTDESPKESSVAVDKKPVANKSKDKEDKSAKFQNYFDYREALNGVPPHRVMAVRRGEAEKILKVSIEVDEKRIVDELVRSILSDQKRSEAVHAWLSQIIADCYKRLLSPAIETEVRLELKTKAEEEAIKVFSKNLENLLLLPPIPNTVVLGIDPGIRTGSKLAVVSETGKLHAYTTIYPQPDKDDAPKSIAAKDEILRLIKTHAVQYIAIGNGTGSREISRLVVAVIKENKLDGIKRMFVNEAGASVYSTDDIAREEFPDLDPTIRSAISIARRLQDPLAELVKIDPRSIGVGQYQHDVNVNKLRSSLEEVVESCVNRVGVDLNTASTRLLSYVSGIGPGLAKNIVQFRDQNGIFSSRKQLLNIGGFGAKAFTLAAGFLRVPSSSNLLDNSSVHPESYELVEQIVKDLRQDLSVLIGNKTLVDAIPMEKYVTQTVGMPTLRDIANELIKPGRDPREDGTRLHYSDDVTEMSDLKVGMELQGTVSNVTNFGAFVDIGVHQDGLVHISELSDQFVKDPATVVAVGDVIKVRVIEVDVQRKRISLSCKTAQKVAPPRSVDASIPRQAGAASSVTMAPPRPQHHHRPAQGQRSSPPQQQHQPMRNQQAPRVSAKPQYTMEDLLNKFNRK